MNSTRPDWPVIIKHQGDAELTYIHDQDEWEVIFKSGDIDFDDTDLLIDSSGTTFSISEGGFVTNNATQSLESILGLVKAHAAQAGSCCVAKLYAPSIKDAFAIVKSMRES
ncbi:MAG: DUF4144 family protein [Gammaproteobacteria bacterium]|jgi:hypothetical protein